jgi:sugar phosphate isomerase/epimerase
LGQARGAWQHRHVTDIRGVPAIQCSTGPFWAFELEPALDAIAEAGFEDIELMVSRDPSTHAPETPARLARERGLRIATVHGPFLAITKAVWGADPLRKIHRGVEMCRAVGAEALIVHPPFLWERPYARWLRALTGDGGGADPAIVVETMYPRWVGRRRLRAYMWTDPAELVEAAPRIALDTSHLAVSREDVLVWFRRSLPKLAHLHLSDNAGDGRDGHLELGRGVLPLDALLSEARRSDYAGTISLEVSVRGYFDQPRALVEALRRNREYVEDRLARGAGIEEGSS